MFNFVFGLILMVLAIAMLVKGELVSVDKKPYQEDVVTKVSIRGLATLPIVLALVLFFFAFTSVVQAKQVGVLTTFGKPSEQTYNSGLAVHLPWQQMTQIDATTQTNEYHGDHSIKVILSDKNTANISATIRWAVNRENANDVYADFRSDDPTDSLRKAVVSTQFKAAMNSEFNNYDATDENAPTPAEMASRVEKTMLTKTNDLVNIKSVTISYIKPDKAVQRKIDALQTQRGATKVAEERQKTARAEASANKILSDSVSKDPNVLVSKCYDMLAEGAFTPPAGFSCWPGSAGSVVIPATK